MKKHETVILLHGMGRSRASMMLLKHRLEKAGYETLNFPYATMTKSLDGLSQSLRDFIKANVKTEKYHFVGHSLGNIIARNGFRDGYPPGLERMVMLAPPNQPSHLAKKFGRNLLYRMITGDSGQRLGSDDFYKDLPVPSIEFGVIAGDKGQSVTFDEPNDRVVTVESTRLPGMKDWILLHHAHTFIMNSSDTAEYVVRFLRTGSFSRS
jgi:pimeloyl-ACP methyl ester carboxylesterase